MLIKEVEPHRLWEVAVEVEGEDGGTEFRTAGFVGYVGPAHWQALDEEGEPSPGRYPTLDDAADVVAAHDPYAIRDEQGRVVEIHDGDMRIYSEHFYGFERVEGEEES